MTHDDTRPNFRRIIYTSLARDADYLATLRQSRVNNGIDGISGLLAFDGRRFVQLIEGPPDSVSAAFKRIESDRRHTAIIVISDTMEPDRAFGGWTMAGMPGDAEALTCELLSAMLKRAPAEVQQAFESV